METVHKVVVHIEVAVSPSVTLSLQKVRQWLLGHLSGTISVFKNGTLDAAYYEDEEHMNYVVKAEVVDLVHGQEVSFWQADLHIHCFRLCAAEPDKDFLDGEEDLPAFEQWELPNVGLQGLWDSIITEPSTKSRLLGYCDSSVRFSDAGVDTNIISWNRMALLHGPPGTGKTTLCKALAQKAFIRNSDRYSNGVLLDINAHSLFSKWFSESGKLVMKLFEHVTEIAEDTTCLVIILVDEAESLASSRSSSSRGGEPGDAVRVVNSVLTSLDALRRRPNVLVLCTTNMRSNIDAAFLDRIDVSAHMGSPGPEARYIVLRSCLVELMNRSIIQPTVQLPEVLLAPSLPPSTGLVSRGSVFVEEGSGGDAMEGMGSSDSSNGSSSSSPSTSNSKSTSEGEVLSPFLPSMGNAGAVTSSTHIVAASSSALFTSSMLELLVRLVEDTVGMSGRGLRKLPLKAHAFYLHGVDGAETGAGAGAGNIHAFLQAMLLTLADAAIIEDEVHV